LGPGGIVHLSDNMSVSSKGEKETCIAKPGGKTGFLSIDGEQHGKKKKGHSSRREKEEKIKGRKSFLDSGVGSENTTRKLKTMIRVNRREQKTESSSGTYVKSKGETRRKGWGGKKKTRHACCGKKKSGAFRR